MAKRSTITVQGLDIRLFSNKKEDYISLTDLAKKANSRSEIIIQNWMRTRNTVEFLGVWEQLHNTIFNHIEFDVIRSKTGLSSFVLSISHWVEKTGAVGILAKPGRYGGTYAHKDIALEFCSWLNPAFKLYVVKEFQRLKLEESKTKSLDWDLKRTLAKVNYRIHTDAIKSHLIPFRIEKTHEAMLVYASEADLLNIALFSMTAKQWREQNPDVKGNIRDSATSEQLLVLANMENLNAEYIKEGLPKKQRLKKLNQVAIYQMELLVELHPIKALRKGE